MTKFYSTGSSQCKCKVHIHLRKVPPHSVQNHHFSSNVFISVKSQIWTLVILTRMSNHQFSPTIFGTRCQEKVNPYLAQQPQQLTLKRSCANGTEILIHWKRILTYFIQIWTSYDSSNSFSPKIRAWLSVWSQSWLTEIWWNRCGQSEQAFGESEFQWNRYVTCKTSTFTSHKNETDP